MKINLEGVFGSFDATLEVVSEPQQRDFVQRILNASRTAVERAVYDLLREVAEEISSASGGAVRAEVVYRGDGAEFAVTAPPVHEPPADADFELSFDASDIERLTLRLPAELKEVAALAAEQAGVSLNTWLSRMVMREAARHQHGSEDRGRRGRRGPGQSLKGWIGG
jgi:hypothetical protein